MNKGLSPSRQMWNRVMTALVWASAVLVMVLVAGIIGMVLVRGIPHISWKFLSTTASVLKKTDGILPAILNTLYVIVLTLLIVLPLGVGAAVYLTEYASNRRLIEVIEFTNETLAGIPSIIYGLVGMLVFSQFPAPEQLHPNCSSPFSQQPCNFFCPISRKVVQIQHISIHGLEAAKCRKQLIIFWQVK